MRMAATAGADRTWYSVAGATLPVMAGILSAAPRGATLLVDRAVHRSVLGALVIGGYRVRWMYPPLIKAGLPLPLADLPADLAGATGVVLTRPTYDGLTAPIDAMVKRAHAADIPVVVDEAHGSHWRGAEYPRSALSSGADVVAHGVHKSEAALTQTGLLHLQGSRVSGDAIDRWWRLLSTSSPSYLLLGSLDRLQWERRHPSFAEDWDRLAFDMRRLWDTLQNRGLTVLQAWAQGQGWSVDPARLTLIGDGLELKNKLAPVGTVEKVTSHSCTLFLAPGQPLQEIIAALANAVAVDASPWLDIVPYPVLVTAMTVREAMTREGQWISVAEAAGRVLADAITPYPPGIPMAVPGEVMSVEGVQWLREWIDLGSGMVHGIKMKGGNWAVWVVQ